VLTLGVVVLNVTDVRRATRFWREALGYEAERRSHCQGCY
jgi:catechol 2,3-dioxygenase-like lactoylglutathione lyase family enzyme